jgi:hypothetical protein
MLLVRAPPLMSKAVSYEAARRASRFAPCGSAPNLSLYQLAALTIGARLAVADA